MGSFPSTPHCGSIDQEMVTLFIRAKTHHPERFNENFHRLGGGLAASSSKNEVVQLRTVLNYVRMMSSKDVFTKLHDEIEQKGFSSQRYRDLVKGYPNVSQTYMTTKRNKVSFLLHLLLGKYAQTPNLETVGLVTCSFPNATNIRIEGMLPVDCLIAFHQAHLDKHTFNKIKELLRPNESSFGNRHNIFDLTRTKPAPETSLKKCLRRNPLGAYDVHGGLTPLHSLCAFGAPTRNAVLMLYEANPGAIIDPSFKRSPLQLLCGPSKSAPSVPVVKLLIALNPMSLGCGKSMASPVALLRKHHGKVQQFETIAHLLDPSRLLMEHGRAETENGIPTHKSVHELVAEGATTLSKIKRCMVEEPGSVDAMDLFGRIPLHIYFLYDHYCVDLLESLLEAPPAPNKHVLDNHDGRYRLFVQEDTKGNTPIEILFQCAGRNCLQNVKYLAKRYSDCCKYMRHSLYAFSKSHSDFFEMDSTLLQILNENNSVGRTSDDWKHNIQREKYHLQQVNKKKIEHEVKETLFSEIILESAAVKIQSIFRMFKIKKVYLHAQTRENAAVDIQRHFRGYRIRKRFKYASKALHGWKLAVSILNFQKESLRKHLNSGRRILRSHDVNTWHNHPARTLIQRLANCQERVQEFYASLREIRLNAYFVTDAQKQILLLLKSLVTLQIRINLNESNLMTLSELDDNEELQKPVNVAFDYDYASDTETTRAPSEYSTVESVVTDYSQGLGAFSGEYLNGLGEFEQHFFRSLEFQLNNNLEIETLDQRDILSLRRIDQYMDTLDAVANGDEIENDAQESISSDSDGWMEGLEESEIELFREIDDLIIRNETEQAASGNKLD